MSSSLLSLVSIISVVVAIVVAEQCPLGYEPYDAATFASNQVVQWTPCPVDDQPSLECATINVLLDYTNSSYGTMTLPVVRIPADSAIAIGKSVFYNPGGPGASGIEPLLDFGDLLVKYVEFATLAEALLTLRAPPVVFTTLLHSIHVVLDLRYLTNVRMCLTSQIPHYP